MSGAAGAPAGGGECVGEYARHVGWRDAAALIADAEGERCRFVEAWEARRGCDRDEHGRERVLGVGVGLRVGVGVGVGVVVVVLFVMVFDCRAEGVLEDLGQDVLHVDRNITVFLTDRTK